MINSININKINNLLSVLCGYFLHYLKWRKEIVNGLFIAVS